MSSTNPVSAVASLTDALKQLEAQTLADLQQADSLDALEVIKNRVLGRKDGQLTTITRGLKDLSEADRKTIGAEANQLKQRLESLLEEKTQTLKAQQMNTQLAAETLDVTMPGLYRPVGRMHPLTYVIREICQIFTAMGYQQLEETDCPEVETEYYNFEALNFPDDHPARDMQDTFYTTVGPQVLLRSQTSNAQIRYMEKIMQQRQTDGKKAEKKALETSLSPLHIQIIAPGRVYRNEQVSSRKNVLFHQIEGLLVNQSVRLSDLKGTLHRFIAAFFNGERPTRFRTSYFPFTEPSVEMDVQCIFCQGKGCRVCSHTGWLEVLGAGMVDPNVLEAVGIDPETYQGFAFGMGVERLAMLKYRIDNIRSFYTNDLRFLQAFQP